MMNESTIKQLVIFPRGCLSQAMIKKMEASGQFIAIEAKDPSQITFGIPSGRQLHGDFVLKCALNAINKSSYTNSRDIFGHEMLKAIMELANSDLSTPTQPEPNLSRPT